MKKSIKTLLAAALLLAFVSPPAFAAGNLRAYVEKAYKEAVTVEVNGADRISLVYSQAVNGRQYLVTAQIEREDGELAAPTEKNLVYIDQNAATNSQVSFTIYPKTLEEDVVYGIYMSSNATASDSGIRDYVRVAKFGLGLIDNTPDGIVMGDVDGDDDQAVTAADAAMVLDFSVKNKTPDERQAIAADVDQDGGISAADAAQILDYSVKNITEFRIAE